MLSTPLSKGGYPTMPGRVETSIVRPWDGSVLPIPIAAWSRSAWVLLAALLLWLTATAGMRPLLLPDERRYASVALGMLHGNWTVPTLNGLPFFHKPPLWYWVDMVAMQVIGVGPFSARMGSLVGAWIMGASLFFGLRRWHGPGVATVALGVLATSPFFFVGAQFANHDMLVAGLISAAIWALARAVESPPRVQLGWLAVGALACALATLTKGFIGVVVPALVIGPWLMAQGRWRQLMGLLHPVAWITYLVVAAPWFLAMQIRYPGFFDYFFMEQHVRRFTQSSFNNIRPFWFFIVALPALMLPWAAWLPHGLRKAWLARDARVGLYAWWIIAVVGFFSWPSSKLVGYVMPAMPPLCALLALALQNSTRKRLQEMFAVAALACLGIVGALAWQAPKSNLGVARALAERIVPGDTVAMVNEYLYDVPFYAGLRQPIFFASNWRDPNMAHQDNWRNELADAAGFAPKLGQQILLPVERLDDLACSGVTVWIPVSLGRSTGVAQLTGATRVFHDKNSELWRIAARSCT